MGRTVEFESGCENGSSTVVVGMSLSLRYDATVMLLLLNTLLFLSPAIAGADPDEHRPVKEGHHRYDGVEVQVGKVYEAFLIQFVDRDDVYLSPSRYRVAYTANALQCRNAASFPITAAGAWWTVTFEVHAVHETAIEEPVGSGNWGWKHAIDCTIRSLVLVE